MPENRDLTGWDSDVNDWRATTEGKVITIAQESTHPQLKCEENCNGIKDRNCWYASSICAWVKTQSRIVLSDTMQSEADLWLYQELLREAPFVEFCWDVQNDWRVKCISPNVSSLLGYEATDFTTWKIRYPDLIHPDDRDKVLLKTDKKHENKAETSVQTYRLIHKDGRIIHVSDRTLNKYDSFGRVRYNFWYIHDITSLKETEIWMEKALNKVRSLLFFDKKFWIPNREKFVEDTEQLSKGKLAIIRVNKFSVFNATFWYAVWDKILMELVKRIQSVLSTMTWHGRLYRLWSVEFWVLVSDDISIDPFISELEDLIRKPMNIMGIDQPIALDYSIWSSEKVDDLYHSWMIAVFKAKESKTNIKYSIELENNMSERHKDNVFWANTLFHAISNDEIVPVYQGIRNNKTGEIDKYESLCRIRLDWKLISPGSFIDIAKATWQDVYITSTMITHVLQNIKRHGKEFSINISMNDLTESWIVELLKFSTAEMWVSPNMLILEILEEIPNMNSLALQNIKALKDAWFKIAIDDFGTWYSNLMRLLEINHDYLKIDGKIVKWVHNDKKQRSILKMITDFAKANWIKTIAEFVDNEEDQAVVVELWIEYTQWYLFSVPSETPIIDEY